MSNPILCLICETNPSGPYAAIVDGLHVCGTCADKVANAYSKAHSGRWYTWANAPYPAKLKERITRNLTKQVFERDAYRCVTCAGHIDLTCDHVIPESKGGETSLENLQTMCRPCNSSKGARQ